MASLDPRTLQIVSNPRSGALLKHRPMDLRTQPAALDASQRSGPAQYAMLADSCQRSVGVASDDAGHRRLCIREVGAAFGQHPGVPTRGAHVTYAGIATSSIRQQLGAYTPVMHSHRRGDDFATAR